EEEIADLDNGAAIGGGRPDRPGLAADDGDLRARVRFGGPALDREPRDGTDRRQRLAAEAERADVEEVAGDLRGAVAANGEFEIGRRHAAAVVADAEQRLAAAGGRDLDARRAGVDSILDQFLRRARRPFDHLAGGNL